LTVTYPPSGVARRMMSPKPFGSCRRPFERTVYSYGCEPFVGGAPIDPPQLEYSDCQRGDDIARGQAVVGQTLGIDPQAHRVLAFAEYLHAAHTGNALQIVDDVVFEVVRDLLVRQARIVGRDADAHHERAVILRNRDAGQLDLVRQPPLREVDRVLHVVGGLVEIAVEVERGGDRRPALVRRLR